MREPLTDHGSKATASSAGRRVWSLATAQLREAAEDALDRLESRVRGRSAEERGKATVRLREVVERDRALRTAGLPCAPSIAAGEPPCGGVDIVRGERVPERQPPNICSEPIRTRTMARLLADQGERERALSIYEHLIAEGSDDAELLAEARALRGQV